MSIQVPAEALADTLQKFGGAYLVTVGEDRRAHVVAVTPRLDGAALNLGRPGRTTRRNVEGNPVISLVWPPLEAGGYSLIADGTGSLGNDVLIVQPTRAVLHRPAAVDAGSGDRGVASASTGGSEGDAGCAADCVEIPGVEIPG